MLDREPFLKAIFAAPDDDLPRLVFADWLDEHGDPAWAELIRVQCEVHSIVGKPGTESLAERKQALADRLFILVPEAFPERRGEILSRGLPVKWFIEVTAEELSDPDAFRLKAVAAHPEWYGATRLKVTEGPIVTAKPLVTILTSPVTEYVTELDLSGREEEQPVDPEEPGASAEVLGFRLLEFTRRPVISTPMVEELAGMRECRRITALDLRNNDLGNDALRALAESPYFTRLAKLRLFEGNRFKGRPWQRVLERFGEAVVE